MSLIRMERDRGIVRMIKKGATYQEVGDAYNISRQRVHQIFRRTYPQPTRQMLDSKKMRVYDGNVAERPLPDNLN